MTPLLPRGDVPAELLRIPGRRNLVLLPVLVGLLATTWWLPVHFAHRPWILVAAALAFGALTQPAYALLHEAMHDIFHPVRAVNDAAGFVLSAIQPSSFRLLRLVHMGHHMSNRSARERIEYYDQPGARRKQAIFYYAVLSGLNWLGFVLQNVVFLVLPLRVIRRFRLDTDFGATLPRLKDGELRLIALEFGTVVLLHALVLVLTPVTGLQYVLFLAANAVFYSQLRYIYHYKAGFDVIEGAFDLRAPRWLTLAVLNGTYHLTHHRYPKVPWVHVPRLARAEDRQHGFAEKLIEQWQGVLPEASQPQRGRVIDWNGRGMTG